MAKVYISSSFKDLRQERRAVADTVTARGHLAVGMESYRATNESAAEFCISDVKSCDFYIGIFAFRYGDPLGPQSKSITQLEYEAAGKAGIKRFIFLLSEDAPWPMDRTDENRTRINALRRLVSTEHMPKYFSNVQELSSFVRDVIDYEFPVPPQEVPAGLYYRCDRGPQEDVLAKVLGQKRDSAKPVGFVVHGDERQAHDMYCKRLREEILPKYLSVEGQELLPKPYKLNWPAGASDVAMARRMIVRELGDRTLRRPNATEAEIQAHFARLPATPVIYASCRGDDWDREGKHSVRAFLDLWDDWPVNPDRHLVVLLFVRYRREVSGFLVRLRPWRSGSRIQTFLGSLANGTGSSCFSVLPRLHDITQQEAEDWAGEEDVATYRPAHEIVAAIARCYGRWRKTEGAEAIPMDDLAPMLQDALERGEKRKDQAA